MDILSLLVYAWLFIACALIGFGTRHIVSDLTTYIRSLSNGIHKRRNR